VNHAKAQKSHLDKRLSKASKALRQLTCRRQCQKLTSKRTVRGYAGKEARVECQSRLEIEVIHNEEALEAERRCLGWRVYGASAPNAILKHCLTYNISLIENGKVYFLVGFATLYPLYI